MATIFSAPQIGDPRATGIKNGGIKAFESDIVYPVSRLTTPDGTWSGGKQLEFRLYFLDLANAAASGFNARVIFCSEA